MKKLTENQIKLINTKISIDGNKHIILIDMAGNKQVSQEECNANIYCIDNHNNILWEVNNTNGMFDRDSFIYLDLASNGKLAARRFFGKKYFIDIASGLAEETGWEK
jgi:hypothetical protein